MFRLHHLHATACNVPKFFSVCRIPRSREIEISYEPWTTVVQPAQRGSLSVIPRRLSEQGRNLVAQGRRLKHLQPGAEPQHPVTKLGCPAHSHRQYRLAVRPLCKPL